MKKLIFRLLILLFCFSLLISSCSEENEKIVNKKDNIETVSKLVSNDINTAKIYSLI